MTWGVPILLLPLRELCALVACALAGATCGQLLTCASNRERCTEGAHLGSGAGCVRDGGRMKGTATRPSRLHGWSSA